MLASTEWSPGIELGTLRLEQRKRRWLDRLAARPHPASLRSGMYRMRMVHNPYNLQ